MAEYIDKEAFLKGIKERYCLPCKGAGKDHDGCKCRACWVVDICGDVIDAPAADVAPVRHARWAKWHGDPRHYCAACGAYANAQRDATGYIEYDFLDSYCSDCGARMDGDEE